MLAVCVLLLAVQSAVSVPPHPEAEAQWKADGVYDEKMANLKAFMANGGCSPIENAFSHLRENSDFATSAAVDTINILVLMIDFLDYKFNSTSYAPGGGSPVLSSNVFATANSLDSLLFSRQGDPVSNPTGSMTDFYYDNSFGKILMTGEVKGWYTAPKNYSYYVSNNTGFSFSGELVEEAIKAAAADGVNFQPFDNDGDNLIEFIIICHAGPGAETGAYGIWSHKSTVGFTHAGYSFVDYSMNPEEQGGAVSNAGVYIHETGHLLSLPDLYDTDGNGDGIGLWSAMAGG